MEIAPGAVKDAKVNVSLNDMYNAEFISGSVGNTLAALIFIRGIKTGKLFLTPPIPCVSIIRCDDNAYQ